MEQFIKADAGGVTEAFGDDKGLAILYLHATHFPAQSPIPWPPPDTVESIVTESKSGLTSVDGAPLASKSVSVRFARKLVNEQLRMAVYLSPLAEAELVAAHRKRRTAQLDDAAGIVTKVLGTLPSTLSGLFPPFDKSQGAARKIAEIAGQALQKEFPREIQLALNGLCHAARAVRDIRLEEEVEALLDSAPKTQDEVEALSEEEFLDFISAARTVLNRLTIDAHRHAVGSLIVSLEAAQKLKAERMASAVEAPAPTDPPAAGAP